MQPALKDHYVTWKIPLAIFAYDELMARDKVNLEIFWLRDDALEDSANLPEPDVLASEIAEDLRFALSQSEEIAEEPDEESKK